MLEKRNLSEAAKWFLEDFQGLLNNFAQDEGVQITLLDKNGDLITEIGGPQRVCGLIRSQEEGRVKCEDGYKMGFSLAKVQQEPVFVECFAGFSSVWLPIIVKGATLGMIVACGKRDVIKDDKEKLTAKFSKMADDLVIMDKEGFLRVGVEEVELTNSLEVKDRADKLLKLIRILEETARTPLKEIFG
ncbi:MAG: PocR ligand-binding domain-containing protein [bacterium]